MTRMSSLVDRLFILLSEYANASGTTKANVNELNQHLFKAVVTILRKVVNQKANSPYVINCV